MANPATEIAVDELSVEERLTLLGRLWDSLLDAGPPPVPALHLRHHPPTDRCGRRESWGVHPARKTPPGTVAQAGVKVTVLTSHCV